MHETDPTPKVQCKGETLLPHAQNGTGIFNSGPDLETVADDGWVVNKAVNVGVGHSGDAVNIEMMEGVAEGVAATQNEEPAEARLEGLEEEVLKDEGIVVDWDAPFSIVVMKVV